MSVYIRKDHWTPTEDKIVRAAVMKYGTNQWSRVASLLVRKSAAQCKARWYEYLDPRLSQSSWTRREDKLLLSLEKTMPNMWRSIGATLGGRTAAQCFERWTHLTESAKKHGSLLEDMEIDESEESEPNSDSEKQMMAEATARLSNSLGKKAKRKQRERFEDEDAFQKSILDHRSTGAPIRVKRSKFAIDYNKDIPYKTLPSLDESEKLATSAGSVAKHRGLRTVTIKRPPRMAGRPKLHLPRPVTDASSTIQEPQISASEKERVRRILADLPQPQTGNTLLTLALLEPADDDNDTGDAPDIEQDVPLMTLDEVLRDDDASSNISAESRKLLETELKTMSRVNERAKDVVTNGQSSQNVKVLNEKYAMLKQKLLNSSRLPATTSSTS